jgi:uncharacterized membrane protein YdjX (TVP38/TMEM64 family)
MNAHRGSIFYAAIAGAIAIFLIRRVLLARWLRRKIPDTFETTATI